MSDQASTPTVCERCKCPPTPFSGRVVLHGGEAPHPLLCTLTHASCSCPPSLQAIASQLEDTNDAVAALPLAITMLFAKVSEPFGRVVWMTAGLSARV